MAAAGARLFDQVYQDVMLQWSTQLSAGGDITLEIQGLPVARVLKTKRLLGDIRGVSSVHFEMSKGIATYRIKAKLTTEQLLERLILPPWDALIEITDIKLNRLQAKSKAG